MLKMAPHLEWLTVPQQEPLDRGGPVEVPFDPFDASWISRPICERFDQIAAFHSEKTAVDDGNICFTYGEIQRASLVLARSIETLVPHGRPVGVLLEHSAFFPIAALACLRVGRPIVPIDPRHPTERNALIGREAGFQAVIFDGVGADLNGLFKDVPRLDIVSSLGILPDVAPEATPADDAAFILYTSGSSGRPKGICNNQTAILHRVAQFTNACHLNADDRFLLLSSTGTIAGIRDIFSALLNGATLVIAEPSRVGFDGILRAMDRGRITICYALPALLRSLFHLREAASAFRHVRILRLGGDTVWERDIALCRATAPPACFILIGYGSTEAPTLFQWFIPRDWSCDGSRVPCGRLLPDVAVALVDERGSTSGAGEIGELLVRSRYLALGHWQDGLLQRNIFDSDSSLSFLRSGDLLRLRGDGLAEVVGRTSRLVKIRGQYVDPGEIETVVRGSDEVADAAAVVRTEDGNASGLDVFVVPRDLATPPRIDDLRAMMAQRLPAHMRPNRIYIIAIPLLAGFKPDLLTLANWNYAEVPRPRQAPNSANGPQAPLAGGSRVRKAVENAWSELLDRASFEMGKSWGEAGGDSLKAMELIVLIEKALDLGVPLELLDENTTPNSLIGALDRLLAALCQSNGSGRAATPVPLVFLMPGIGGDEPALARMRAELRTRIRFVTIKYPSSSAMIEAEARFDAIADAAIAQIRWAAKSDNVIHLAGYSFGGFVVWEVARRLLAAGSRIGTISLIDARRARDVASLERQQKISTRVKRAIRHILLRPRQSAHKIQYLAKYSITSRLPLVLLWLLHSMAMRLPTGMALVLPQNYDGELRERALNNFTLSKLDHPATLFRSTNYIKEFPDNGWSDVCPQLTVVPIDGTHVSMLDSPGRAGLAERLCEAVAAVEVAAATRHPQFPNSASLL
jgi:acyl-coenzyme A synthetase/AMP-(fatty) acid ligase/thioesterase domain-containing protein/acyl carrier protein